MKIPLLSYFFIALFVFFGYYVISDDFVTKHESVHEQIYMHYGIDSVNEKTGFLDFITKLKLEGSVAPNMTQYNERCTETCRSLQIQNEIVSYNSKYITFFFVMLFLAFTIMFILILAYLNVLTKILITERGQEKEWY